MVRVLALTQFAFLTLAIVSLKIMVHANPSAPPSGYLQTLNGPVLWLFGVPLVWIAFASACAHIDKAPLTPGVARFVGMILAVASFLFLVSVTFG